MQRCILLLVFAGCIAYAGGDVEVHNETGEPIYVTYEYRGKAYCKQVPFDVLNREKRMGSPYSVNNISIQFTDGEQCTVGDPVISDEDTAPILVAEIINGQRYCEWKLAQKE